MKKAFLLIVILFVSVISTACINSKTCINNPAIQQLNNKAKAYLDKGDFENAISRLKASIDLDGTVFETHYNLGIAYTQAEKYPEAIETFTEAAKLKPDFADTYYSLAVTQENYAKGIIDGSLKKATNAQGADVNQKEPEISGDKKQELTTQDKEQIIKLFNDSIASYETYLKKGNNIEDKKDIEDKIEYLKAQCQTYSAQSK